MIKWFHHLPKWLEQKRFTFPIVCPKLFARNLICRLHTLYAQLWRIALAHPVLPRLLARVLDSACPFPHVIIHENLWALGGPPYLHSRPTVPRSGVNPLSKSLHCSLHKKSGQCLSPNMAVLLPVQPSMSGLRWFQHPNYLKLRMQTIVRSK